MHIIPGSADDPIIVVNNLVCGCQDLYYASGFVDYEHDHIVCDGKPIES